MSLLSCYTYQTYPSPFSQNYHRWGVLSLTQLTLHYFKVRAQIRLPAASRVWQCTPNSQLHIFALTWYYTTVIVAKLFYSIICCTIWLSGQLGWLHSTEALASTSWGGRGFSTDQTSSAKTYDKNWWSKEVTYLWNAPYSNNSQTDRAHDCL